MLLPSDRLRCRITPGWVAVDVAYAGICGSDLHIAAGEYVRAQPGTVLGHEFVGHLAEPYGDLPVGQPVFVNPIVHCGVCEACLAGRTNVCRTLTLVGIDYPGAIAPRTAVHPNTASTHCPQMLIL